MNHAQAKSLCPRDELHYTGVQPCIRTVGPKGGVTIQVTTCRVSGQPKTWKRSPERVKVPVKRGLYANAYLTQDDLDDWHLASECPLLREASGGDTEPIVEDGTDGITG